MKHHNLISGVDRLLIEIAEWGGWGNAFVAGWEIEKNTERHAWEKGLVREVAPDIWGITLAGKARLERRGYPVDRLDAVGVNDDDSEVT